MTSGLTTRLPNMRYALTLTEREEKTLHFVVSFIDKHGYSPSVREVATGSKVSVAVAHHRLERLRTAGAVTWTAGTPRTLRVAS